MKFQSLLIALFMGSMTLTACTKNEIKPEPKAETKQEATVVSAPVPKLDTPPASTTESTKVTQTATGTTIEHTMATKPANDGETTVTTTSRVLEGEDIYIYGGISRMLRICNVIDAEEFDKRQTNGIPEGDTTRLSANEIQKNFAKGVQEADQRFNALDASGKEKECKETKDIIQQIQGHTDMTNSTKLN